MLVSAAMSATSESDCSGAGPVSELVPFLTTMAVSTAAAVVMQAAHQKVIW